MARLVQGTKSKAEREDDETERLVRPPPKKKPPRHDLRREQVDTDRDPNPEPDPDTTRNYKNIGGSARWAKADERIPARNRAGEVVLIAPRTLQDKPGEYEELKPEEAEKAKAEALKAEEKEKGKEKGKPKPGDKSGKPRGGDDDVAGGKGDDEKKKDKGDDEDEDEPDLIGQLARVLLKELGDYSDDEVSELLDPKKDEDEEADDEGDDKGGFGDDDEKADDEDVEGMGGPEGPETESAEPDAEDEEPEQSEAEKAGIPEPKRREATDADKTAADAMIVDVFPPEAAKAIIKADMHPDDVRDMAMSYRAMKEQPIGDPAKFAAKMTGVYQTDPKKVPPPDFDEGLSDEEKGEVYREHQLTVVAASMAAREQITEELSMPSMMGEPRLPKGLASNLASVMLSSPSKGELDKLTKAAEGGDKEAKAALDEYEQTVESVAQGTFDGALESGKHIPVRASVAKGLMRHLKDNPGAQKAAQSFLEANDYHEAKSKFLGEGGITEHSSPREIIKGLEKADKWFAKQAEVYGSDEHSVAGDFRNKVMNKLAALSPETYYEVQGRLDKRQAKDYDKAEAKYKREYKAWEKKKNKAEESLPFGGHGVVAPGAKVEFNESEPEKPVKPIRYGQGKDSKDLKAMGKDLHRKLFEKTKKATQHYVSTYSRGSTMGQTADKTGVYHGLDPAHHDPGAYTGWSQADAADLGPEDFDTILSAARDWMQNPALNEEDGEEKARSALDLAIKSAGYIKSVDQPLYDMLLGRLMGREAAVSSCALAPSAKVSPVKASREIRKMAAKTARTDPKLAYDLTDLADRLADNGKFSKLRSLIIRTAATDAGAKRVLLPILQAIKALD